MKNILFGLAIATTAFSCTVKKASVATPVVHTYDTSYDNAKLFKGLVTRQDIENDTSFKWFKANMQLGTASATAIEAFKKNGSKFKMVVFFGTWCEDSQNLVPIFYRLVDKSGYSDSSITLIAVDRKKTTLDNLHTAFHITNVPTFIVMKDGKEVSRIVEYGKYGEIDKELGEIVAGIQ